MRMGETYSEVLSEKEMYLRNVSFLQSDRHATMGQRVLSTWERRKQAALMCCDMNMAFFNSNLGVSCLFIDISEGLKPYKLKHKQTKFQDPLLDL
jgi:hypothetical protein